MEIDISDSLEDLGYEGLETEESKLEETLNGKPVQLARLVSWLGNQLQRLLGLESSVTSSDEDMEALNFHLEVSSLLKELNCPHSQLMEGPLENRLEPKLNKILLLDYLCSEAQTAHLLAAREKDRAMEVDADSDSLDRELETTAKLLGLKSDSPIKMMTMLATKVEEILPSDIPEPLLSPDQPLTPEQWDILARLDATFSEEYHLRRQMLITRLDCTVTSFSWSDRLKDKQEEITSIYLPLRTHMKAQPNVHLDHLLSACADLLEMEKTSSANLRKNTRSSVNKVVIGPVPDRGGRPEETNPPPPEMPSWQKRSGPPSGGFHSGGGGWQQRGGKFQGHRGKNRQNSSNSHQGGRRRF